MMGFLLSCGVFLWPIVATVAALLFKTLRLAARVRRRDRLTTADLVCLPFWGVLALVLGLLGQFSGIYRALQVIRTAAEISPTVIAEGLAQSFATTLLGAAVLLLSLLFWALLKIQVAGRPRSIASGGWS